MPVRHATMTYKMDKFLKATVPLDKGMGLLAVLLHCCILVRVIADVSMSKSSRARKVVVHISLIAQGVLWILTLFGTIRYLALLSSYELLSELAAVLLVPCAMALFLAATFIYMLLFEAAARTVWKAAVERMPARIVKHCAAADDSASDGVSGDEDIDAEEGSEVTENHCEENGSAEESEEESDVEAAPSRDIAGLILHTLTTAALAFRNEWQYVCGSVVRVVVGPWAPAPLDAGEERKCSESDDEEGADIAAEEAQSPKDAALEEISCEGDTESGEVAEEARHWWRRL